MTSRWMVCAVVLSAVLAFGCSSDPGPEPEIRGEGGSVGEGGTGGVAGDGGNGGNGGMAGSGSKCEEPDAPDNRLCTEPCFLEIINKPGFEQDVLDCRKPETLCLQNLGLGGQCQGCYFEWLDCARFCANGPGPCDCDGDFRRCSGLSEVFPGSQ